MCVFDQLLSTHYFHVKITTACLCRRTDESWTITGSGRLWTIVATLYADLRAPINVPDSTSPQFYSYASVENLYYSFMRLRSHPSRIHMPEGSF